MTIEKNQICDTIVAGQDLRTLQYKVVTVAGSLSTNVQNAWGVLQNKPNTNEHGTACVFGFTKAIAAAAIAQGANLRVSSGFMITAVSGDGVCIGKARNAANSGDTFTAFVSFGNGQTFP